MGDIEAAGAVVEHSSRTNNFNATPQQPLNIHSMDDNDNEDAAAGDDREEFQKYNELQESLTTFSFFSIGTFIFLIADVIVKLTLTTMKPPSSNIASLNLFTIITEFALLLLLIMLVLIKFNKKFDSDTVIGRLQQWKGTIQNWILILITGYFSVLLNAKVRVGDCSGWKETNDSELLYSFYCNDGNALPAGTLLALLLVPMTFYFVIRDTRYELIMISWCFGVIALLLTGTPINGKNVPWINFVAPTFLYVIGTFVIYYESHRQNLAMYLLTKKLQQTLAQNEALADEAAATELRHMIANVAHDLKTPLTSFLIGIDYIAQLVDSSEDVLCQTVEGENFFEEQIAPIRQCVDNVRNTNAFMIMTINRCIDYTKASKGMKLVPKPETIDLREALNLPLRVMRNLQQRVDITLHDEIMKKQICSHIITDKQWLQENLLCLLSNAVKYSGRGTVEIDVQLVPERTVRKQFLKRRRRLNALVQAVKTFGAGSSQNDVIFGKDIVSPSINYLKVASYAQILRNRLIQQRITKHSRVAHSAMDDEEQQFQTGDPESSPSKVGSPSKNQRGPLIMNMSSFHFDNSTLVPSNSFINRSAQSVPAAEESLERTRSGNAGGDDSSDDDSDENENISVVQLNDDKSLSEGNGFVVKIPKTPEVAIQKNSSHSHGDDVKSQELVSHGDVAPNPEVEESKMKGSLPQDSKGDDTRMVLKVSVTDMGIGLSDAAMQNLFNPFKQAQRLAGGTGLGLYSLAKRLEALGGYYGVRKRPDGEQGSVFWFAFEYRPDHVTAQMFHSRRSQLFEEARKALEKGNLEKVNGTGLPDCLGGGKMERKSSDGEVEAESAKIKPRSNQLNALAPRTELGPSASRKSSDNLADLYNIPASMDILLVDDAISILKLSSMMLKRKGHVITQAENGVEALDKFKERSATSRPTYDVIIMDLQMPVMDGLEAIRRMRDLEKAENAKIAENDVALSTKLQVEASLKTQLLIQYDENNGLTSSIKARFVQKPRHQLIIGCSANSDHETMTAALHAGADAFMAKPFTIDTFYEIMDQILNHIKP